LLSGILILFGLYFAWDAYRSFRSGLSNYQWGFRYSRVEAPKSFWLTIGAELVLAAIAFVLAAYIAIH